jgi:hypothetical protein
MVSVPGDTFSALWQSPIAKADGCLAQAVCTAALCLGWGSTKCTRRGAMV